MAHTADVVAGTVALSTINIDGGSITGITDLAVADGGTGSSTASGARSNLGLGTSATVDVGTSASQIPQLNGSGQLPAVSGALLTNLPVTDVSSDVRLLALQVASDRIGLEDGIADPFTDETDVDTSTSTGETHNSTGTFYSGGAQSEIDRTSGSNIGDATGHGGLAAAFDGTTNQAAADSAKKSSATDTYVGKDYGSGVSKTITKAIVTGSNNVGFYSPNDSVTITARLYASNSTPSNSGDGTLLATASATDANSLALTMDASSNSTAYRYAWVRVTHTGSADSMYVAEVQLFETTSANMTLVSNAFTADAAPATTVIGVQVVENESITVNTDLTAEVSRDGGSNFTACTLALKTSLAATGTKYYESGSTDISSQPSGTSIKYRIKTLNTKNIEIHGVALKWAA